MLLNNFKYLYFPFIPFFLSSYIFLLVDCLQFSSLNYKFLYYSNFNRLYFSAVKQGTDMLELDLHMTKDEKVVVSHDNNLLRVTGIDVNISDLNYEVSLK